ncbi:EF-hand calcium-binding domain-containing protein 9-like [Triplophysa rosa]|uniref:EF-hand calcium-binding domain-containing protein 9-like n=1 Tax=Triplophysa rosa TaxID=992332 RepID=A0A9W7TT06_TRIRA|nr:EF-hand calcium-binding domain-containing protein 9-like [Triplophysa rosa]KAI7801863.1 putative EF-hand calcium-binding domain-containing protein 9-like [Triplophysa rosa]
MKLKKGVFFHNLDFDTNHCLFSLSNTRVIYEYFCLLDVHLKRSLNDVQFFCFMRHVTDLKKTKIMLTFDMLDSDGDGEIRFDEFYILACILLSSKHHVGNRFLHRHPHSAFNLLDVDCSRTIILNEFKSLGFLFNLKSNQIEKLFSDFDTTHDERLNYKEFQMFTKMYNLSQEKE